MRNDQLVVAMPEGLLQLLRQITLECQHAFDVEALANRVVYRLAEALELPRICLALIQDTALHIIATGMGGIDDFNGVLPLSLQLDQPSLCAWVVQHRESLLVTSTVSDARYLQLAGMEETTLELVVPIINPRNQILGVIDIQSTQPEMAQRFKTLQPVLEQIGLIVGTALETITLQIQIAHRNRYAHMLDTIRGHAEQQYDLGRLLNNVRQTMEQALYFRGIALYLVEYSTLVLQTSSATITAPQRRMLVELHERPTPLQNSLATYPLHTTTPPALLDIPLLSGTTLLGIVSVYPILPLGPSEFELLQETGKILGQLIERTRLFASMYRTSNRTTLFARIVSVVRQSINIDQIIDQITELLVADFGVDWCSLALINESNRLSWLGTQTNPRQPADYPAIASIIQQEIEQAVVEQRTCIIDDLLYTTQIGNPQRSILLDHGVRALAWTPLQIDDQWIGTLSLIAINQPRRWSFDDLQLLSDIADQLAVAYRQMRVYAAEQQRRRELEVLQEIIGSVSGELDFSTICQSVLEKTVGVLNLQAAAIVLQTPLDPQLQVSGQMGLEAQQLAALQLTPGQLQRWLAAFPPEEPIASSQLQQHPLLADVFQSSPHLQQLYAQPLLDNGSFVGWLQMYRTNAQPPFAPHETNLARAIAYQIAQSLHSTRRYEQERLLRTDAEQSYSELRAVIDELEQTRERLLRSERLRALGELSSGVAHDFNNLLTAILGNTQYLLQDEHPGERREALSMIEQAARDGSITVRRIQEFARSAETVYDEVVDLQQVVEVGLEFTRPSWRDQAQQRGITITIETQLQPAWVLGSAAELREIFINLLVNAVDAMPTGGVITVQTASNHEWAGFSVADTGPGVSAENRLRIFDPFFTTKPLSQGTGLGLAVALSIVQRHRGTLTVEQVQPHGAQFIARFPVHRSESTPPRQVQPPQQHERSILVVDDDPSVRQIVSRLLQRDRHQVQVASTGEEAVQLLPTQPFDIIISDLGMPGLNGWQVLSEARRLYPNIGTVLLTGWGFQIDHEQPQTKIADKIMSKPFEIQDLRATIAGLIEGQR